MRDIISITENREYKENHDLVLRRRNWKDYSHKFKENGQENVEIVSLKISDFIWKNRKEGTIKRIYEYPDQEYQIPTFDDIQEMEDQAQEVEKDTIKKENKQWKGKYPWNA